mgnify:CR=1 FL=1
MYYHFEDEDFLENDFKTNIKNEEPKKIYGDTIEKLYESINYSNESSNKPYGAPSKEAFKPTPIISPIYGVLDKNYRKDEIKTKKKVPQQLLEADFNSIKVQLKQVLLP